MFWIRLLFVIAVGFSVSCISEPLHNSDVDTITVPLNSSGGSIKMSDVIDGLEYVRLETTKECLIGKVDRIIPLEHVFLFVDRWKTCSVFIFDREGKFVRKISRRGKGPQEYISLTDADYDTDAGQLIILDSFGRKLLFYSLEGKFVKQIDLNGIFQRMAYIGSGKIALYSDYKKIFNFETKAGFPNIVLLDVNTGEQKGDLFFDKHINPKGIIISLSNNFSKFSEHASGLIMPLNDTIYRLSDDGAIEREYFVDLGPRKAEAQAKIMKMATDSRRKAGDAGKAYKEATYPVLIECLRTKDVIYMFYTLDNLKFYGFYYPKTNKFIEAVDVSGQEFSYSSIPIINDYDGAVPFCPQNCDSVSFYYMLEPRVFTDFKTVKDSCVRAIAKTVSANDNPVLIRATIKQR